MCLWCVDTFRLTAADPCRFCLWDFKARQNGQIFVINANFRFFFPELANYEKNVNRAIHKYNAYR